MSDSGEMKKSDLNALMPKLLNEGLRQLRERPTFSDLCPLDWTPPTRRERILARLRATRARLWDLVCGRWRIQYDDEPRYGD